MIVKTLKSLFLSSLVHEGFHSNLPTSVKAFFPLALATDIINLINVLKLGKQWEELALALGFYCAVKAFGLFPRLFFTTWKRLTIQNN